MANKPNIVYIFPDQHRSDAMGFVRPEVITPNLDRLAQQGVVFGQCCTNSPLCMPARASMMSGQYVSKHGCWNNNSGSDADASGPSHVRSVREAGYHTAVIGKDHLSHFPPGIKPADRRQWYRDLLVKGWGFDEPLTTHTRQSLSSAFPRMPPSGEPSYPQILEEHGLMKAQREHMADYFDKCHRGEVMPWEDEASPIPSQYHLDTYIGQRAARWIDEYADTKPFYLQVNFSGPHDPFDSPQEYRDKYRLQDIPVGKLVRPAEPVAPYVQTVLTWSNIKSMTEDQYRQGCINYYAMVTLIDEQVGTIAKALADRGIDNNTWIIYNSDHGEMLGDHFMRHKIVFYSEAVNVPCIIRPPSGVKGWKSGALVETVDMSVTMMDIAGGKMAGGTPGVSLKDKVLAGPDSGQAQKSKQYVFSEVNGFFMVRDNRYKLGAGLGLAMDRALLADATKKGRDELIPVEFYDMRDDPGEFKNVVNDPGYRVVQDKLAEVLKKHIAENLDMERLVKVLSTPSDGRFGMS